MKSNICIWCSSPTTILQLVYLPLGSDKGCCPVLANCLSHSPLVMKMRKVTKYLHPWQAQSSNIQKPWKEIKQALAHSQTNTHDVSFPETSGKRVIEKQQCRLWSRRGSGPSQDAAWCKKQEVTLKNASAEWRVSLCLLATLFGGFAQFVCFSVSVSLGEFGAVHSSERP